jgi:hypothetical protein
MPPLPAAMEKIAAQKIFAGQFDFRSAWIYSVEINLRDLASYFAWRKSATHSTCCVCGNMSSGCTRISSKTPSQHKMFKSRAIVAG